MGIKGVNAEKKLSTVVMAVVLFRFPCGGYRVLIPSWFMSGLLSAPSFLVSHTAQKLSQCLVG